MQCLVYRFTGIARLLTSYASYLTIAAIAVTRSVGILMSRFNRDTEARTRTFTNPVSAAVGCVVIWVLAFAMIAPSAFSITIGSYYVSNNVSYVVVVFGRCIGGLPDPFDGPNSGIFNVAIFIPLVFILVSYIFIIAVLEGENRRKQRILKNQTQVPVRQIQLTLVALSAAVLIFGLPLVILQNIPLEQWMVQWKAYLSLFIKIAWGWYFWIFAFNVILYVTTLQDFRMMFKQVLKEFIFCLPVTASTKANVDEMSSTKKSSTITI